MLERASACVCEGMCVTVKAVHISKHFKKVCLRFLAYQAYQADKATPVIHNGRFPFYINCFSKSYYFAFFVTVDSCFSPMFSPSVFLGGLHFSFRPSMLHFPCLTHQSANWHYASRGHCEGRFSLRNSSWSVRKGGGVERWIQQI